MQRSPCSTADRGLEAASGETDAPGARAGHAKGAVPEPHVRYSALACHRLNASGDGLWDWDAVTNAVYYSPRYIEMLGYTPETFPATLKSWEEKIHPEDYAHVVPIQKDIIASPAHGDTFECTYRMRRADNTWAWILGRGNVTQRDASGRATPTVLKI